MAETLVRVGEASLDSAYQARSQTGHHHGRSDSLAAQNIKSSANSKPCFPQDRPASELAHRIRNGDRSAEDELVSRYSAQLEFLVHRWTRDGDDAQDLYQESVRLALEKLRNGELKDSEKLAPFLRSLARNLCRHYYRLNDRREKLLYANGPPCSPPPCSLGRILLREKAEMVRSVLADMPQERDREILYRYYIAEQEKPQICKDLMISSAHFKRVLFRARERFRDLYESRS
jgi:RNA polymerase sigma-70 factor (ECF subfamily)